MRTLLIGVLVVGFIVGVSLGLTLFLAEDAIVLITCMVVMLSLSYGLFGIYGWIWGRGAFDLIGKPPR